MNIYNFIFCYFYTFWQKRNGDGKFSAILHIFFASLIHIFLIVEILQDVTGKKISLMPRLGNYGESKIKYLLLSIPILVLINLYYNRERTKDLLKIYHEKFDHKRNNLRIIFYVIVPTILLISLALLRQNGYFG